MTTGDYRIFHAERKRIAPIKTTAFIRAKPNNTWAV